MTAHAQHPNEAGIREHYDRLSRLYQRFWGEHIHHGWWDDGESLAEAQEKLIQQLACAATVPRAAHVLDVGCGLGGSALWLARELGCSVHGITLSPVQVEIARHCARESGLDERLRFDRADAERLELQPECYDVVWSVECTEHFVDKPGFIARAAGALKPGGTMAICAWLAEPRTPDHDQLVRHVCRGMLCPSLASRKDYVVWLQCAGLELMRADDVTLKVARTWDLAQALLGRAEVRAILKVSDRATQDFARAFTSIRDAYACGAMSYGLFAARKPERNGRMAIAPNTRSVGRATPASLTSNAASPSESNTRPRRALRRGQA